ncbi:response regulator [Chloroflexota bacterium]
MEPKILVADGEASTLQLMEAMLVQADYQVILAETGTEAITKALLTSPDVILLDAMMPGLDGFEVTLKLRANKQTKDIPIVMVMALGAVRDRVRALESGADDFLTKPVDKTELLAKVKTLVEKSERIRQLIVAKKKPLVPIVSSIVAVIAVAVSIILIVTGNLVTASEPTTDTEAVANLDKPGFQAGIKVETVQRVVKQIEYRDVVREVAKEVMVEKPIEQREFPSKEELVKWLAEDDDTKKVYFFVKADSTEVSSYQYDCDDYALELQKRALKDGYLMSATIIEKEDQLHMINLVTIGNKVYYIEPQTDEVWFYCDID